MTISFAERMRAFGWFLIGVFYAGLAYLVANHAAHGLAQGDFYELTRLIILLFLLLLGYVGMGMVGQQQRSPLRSMGLWVRQGWFGEFSLGMALGWGGMVATVIPIAILGEMALKVDSTPHQFIVLLFDLAVLALGALAEEVVFRGYPFKRMIEAIGPGLATVFVCVLFTVAHLQNPDFTSASACTTLLAGLVLATAYLRTRALWVCWGLHFAWNASMGLLFGLPVSGLTVFSPVVSTYTRGPAWLTGGGYGPEGSVVAIVVLFGMLFVLIRSTRELKHRYAGPVIIPAGIAVDIDALSRRQHEVAMGPQAPIASQQLVQILGATAPARVSDPPVIEDGEPHS